MFRFKVFLILACLLVFLAFATIINAEVPHLINYQGCLTDDAGQPVEDGEYQMQFRIHNDSIAYSPVWTSQPETILVINGLFNFQLGSKENIPAWIFENDTALWLGITVGSGPEPEEITPRTRLAAAPYAFHAYHADYAEYADSAGVAIGLEMCTETAQYTTQSWVPPPASLNPNEIKLLFCKTFSNTDDLQVSLSVVVTTGTCAGYPGRVTSITLSNDYAVVALQGWNGSSWTDLSGGDEVDVSYVAIKQ